MEQEIQEILHILQGRRRNLEENATNLAQHIKQLFQQQPFNGSLTQSQRNAIAPALRKVLLDNEDYKGAGFAFCQNPNKKVGRGDWTAEWWMCSGDNYCFSFDLESNYKTLPRPDNNLFTWYQIASETHLPYMHGPFLDYGCTNSYVVTQAVPVVIDDVLVGVCAIDVSIHRLDSILKLILSSMDVPALVVGQDGRVVSSTSREWSLGQLWPHAADADIEHEFSLIVLQPEQPLRYYL